ncbi:MAG: hypothetical protein ACRDRR_00315 [Pseudonocardiaceae bacterium]
MIQELRVLPPLAIARFGAAATPLDNYDVIVDPERPLGYRALRPAPTLEVDADSGEIVRTFIPERLSFTENGKVRPVAPFLEVWALTDGGQLEPLTTELLEGDGASPADLSWRVQVANYKVFRRTGDEKDKVDADTGEFSDHTRRPLAGACANFWRGRTIPFGHVQYIKPTEAHPEVRLRFTPAAGFVYGSSDEPPPEGPAADPNLRSVVYDASPGRGTWLGYQEPDEFTITVPSGIFASDLGRRSRGYLDDGCDGLVRVTLTIGGQTLSAYGRVGAGPPTYAPDAVPIRTVADELEQALFGPTVSSAEATLERVEEILRRAFETVRLMNTAAMNSSGMVFHDEGRRRRREPIMATSLVDAVALENLHQSLLVALRSGTAPWFADVLRDYDEIGDLSNRGRRKMPAMMRGADGLHLTLTRRQIDLIRTLVRGPIFPGADQETP